MDLIRDQHGGSSSNPISIQVPGVRSICIPDSTPMKISKLLKLSYYRGTVKCGNQSDEMDASDAVVFQLSESQAAKKYARLISFDHHCVLEVLGHGMGVGALQEFSFLALRLFETTFQEYIDNKDGVDQFGRFTEDFIKLISDIIDALEELHHLGWYCPYLKGAHIAVFKHCDSVSAKLWDFRKCNPGDETEMDKDWTRLGYLILSAARSSLEVEDLYKRICNGTLKGRSILKHSALLTVRKKFDNVVHLDFHVSLNYPDMKTGPEGLKIEELCIANLSSDLDRNLFWRMPPLCDWKIFIEF
ncbi:unnamed protein product [Urochloa humidicola]